MSYVANHITWYMHDSQYLFSPFAFTDQMRRKAEIRVPRRADQPSGNVADRLSWWEFQLGNPGRAAAIQQAVESSIWATWQLQRQGLRAGRPGRVLYRKSDEKQARHVWVTGHTTEGSRNLALCHATHTGLAGNKWHRVKFIIFQLFACFDK